MAHKYREEIVGKRFLSVRSEVKPKLKQISEWEWRSGVVRAVSQRELDCSDVLVLVEFDDRDWNRREWIKINEIFHVFLVESTLHWAQRTRQKLLPDCDKLPSLTSGSLEKFYWPALSFKAIVDRVGFRNTKQHPVEFLVDKHVQLVDLPQLRNYKEEDTSLPTPAHNCEELKRELLEWHELQACQNILLTTPTVLFGYRIKVYRSEGTTQWYTAVIQSYDDSTKELTVLDDTVLEEHNVDPALVQMRIIGDGVVDSILRGENLGITPRRRSCNVRNNNSSTESSSRYRNTGNNKQKADTSKKQQSEKEPAKPSPQAAKPSPLATVEEEKKPEKEVKVRNNLRKRKSEDPVSQNSVEPKKTTPKHSKVDDNRKSPASKQVLPERSKDSRDRDKTVYDKNLHKANLSPKVLVKHIKTPPNSRVSLRRDTEATTPTRSKVAEKRTSLPPSPSSGSRTPSPRPTKSTRKAAVSNPSSTDTPPKGKSGNTVGAVKSSPAARAKSPSHAQSPSPSLRSTRAHLELKRESRSKAPKSSPSRVTGNSPATPIRPITRDSKSQEKSSGRTVKGSPVPTPRNRSSNRKSVTPTPDEPRSSPALKGKQTHTQEEDSSVRNTKSTAKPKCDNNSNSSSSSNSQSEVEESTTSNRTKGNKREELPEKVKENFIASCDKLDKRNSPAPTAAAKASVKKVSEADCKNPVNKVSDIKPVVPVPLAQVESPKTSQKPEATKAVKEVDSPKPKPSVKSDSPKPVVSREEIRNEKYEKSTAEAPPTGALSQVSAEARVEVKASAFPITASAPVPATTSNVSLVKQAQAPVSTSSITALVRPKLKPTSAPSKHPLPVSSLLHPPKEMHYKKIHLLSDSKKESKSEQDPSYAVSSGINVNVSITDQLTKVAKDRNWNNNDDPSGSYNGESTAPPPHSNGAQEAAPSRPTNNGETVHHPSSVGPGGHHPVPIHNNHSDHHLLHRSQIPGHGPSMTLPGAVLPGEPAGHRLADTHRPKDLSTASAASSDYESSRVSEDRAASRSSADEKRPSSSSSSLSNSRMDDYQRRKEMDSQGSSPLVFDKNKPIEVYRDPELLKRDEIRYHQQTAALRASSHTPVPPPSSPYPPGVHAPLPTAHAAALAQRTLLSSLPYGSGSALGALSGLSPHLGMAHSLEHSAALRTQAYLQQQYHALGLPPQHLSSYAMHPNMQTAQLEVLWQQKYPTLPVPPAWMLNQYQDELLRDVNLFRDREMAAIERDRRDREIVRQREHEREKAAAEQERRDREERERKEREKETERRRAELERAERERLEKERAAQAEKERIERERADSVRRHEAAQREDRQRILQESAQTAAAVDQHFSASLRLASQKVAGTWTPSITLGIPKQQQSPGQSGSAAPANAQPPHPGAQYPPPHAQHRHQPDPHRPDEKREVAHSGENKPSAELLARQAEEKRQMTIQQEHLLRQQILREHDQKSGGGTPLTPQQQQAYLASMRGAPAPPSTGAPASSSTVGSGGVKQEPTLNLYGYQPFPHTYISQDKLYSHLKDDKSRIVKDEHGKVLQPPPAHQGHSPAHSSSGGANPPPLIKDQAGKSVIVDNRTKDEPGAQQRYPQPQPAHEGHGGSHHGLPPAMPVQQGSIVHGSPKAHLKPGQEPPRPAHSGHMSQYKGRTQSPHHGAGGTPPAPAHQDHKPPGPSSGAPPHAHGGSAPAAAQPPMSMSSYSYNLIQQGLVPNPIYQQAASALAQGGGKPGQQQAPAHGAPSHPAGNQPASSPPGALPVGHKRRNSKDMNAESVEHNKRPKTSGPPGMTPAGPIIPVTTAPVPTNAQPYTIPTSHARVAPPNTTANAQAATTSPAAQATSPSGKPSTYANIGFIDSFKTFVENTVQSEFNSCEGGDTSKQHPKGRHKDAQPPATAQSVIQQQHSAAAAVAVAGRAPASQQQYPTTAGAPPTSLPSKNTPVSLPMSTNALPSSAAPALMSMHNVNSSVITEGSGVPPLGAGCPLPAHLTTNVARAAPSASPGGASISSTSSIMETINRVANGFMDTDSDTLSAPSPPPHVKGEGVGPSPLKSSNHTKGFKKAWLQRYSDEDKTDVKKPSSLCGSEAGDCYTFTGKEEEKVPPKFSSIKQDLMDESTTSASEAESQEESNKRRMKPKKKRSDGPSSAKKPKIEDKDIKEEKKKDREATPPANKKSRAKGKGRDGKEKKGSDEEVKEQKNDEERRKETQKNRAKTEIKTETKVKFDSEMKMEKKFAAAKRKGKEAKDGSGKNENLSVALANKPLNKTSIPKLRKTMEPFIQDSSCGDIAPKLMKCRECKMTTLQRNKKMPNIFCRFYAFRRLKYNQKQMLSIAGFSEPSDAEADDIELWMPRIPLMEPVLDLAMAKYMITSVGDKFCEMVEQEKEAMSWVSPDTKVAWKRAVQGVREMCDVCETTLFNMHWVCHKCGFVVCIDCYRQRTRKSTPCSDAKCTDCECVEVKWLTCSVNRQGHEPEKLMLTQIIPSDALWALGKHIHEVRDKWHIHSNCPCQRSKADMLLNNKNGVTQLLNAVSQCMSQAENSPTGKVNGVSGDVYSRHSSMNGSPNNAVNPLSLLADVAIDSDNNSIDGKKLSRVKEALQERLQNTEGEDLDDKKNSANCSTLRDLLTKTAGKVKPDGDSNNKKSKAMHSTLDDIIQQVVERKLPNKGQRETVLKHYIPRSGTQLMNKDIQIPLHNLTETSVLFPDVPHSWLDGGRLLRLIEPKHKGNLKLFQQQWRRAQPVLVSNCQKAQEKNLWNPNSFLKDFGKKTNDLVNCRTGVVIVGHTMAEFWEGFDCIGERLVDENEEPMILKLKDWPPTEDFAETMPNRFQDLMRSLPLPEYTHRNGVLNLASRLPDFFVKPDLGPKMYVAYGSALHPKEGTTNLHLDISDAVNTMVYVGIPKDDTYDHQGGLSNQEAAFRAIEDAGCDDLTKKRVKEGKEKPGALWHIFDPRDADKIRDLLNKMAKERGETIEAHHDPIHDQSWYLDNEIRKRLLEEYNVQGYTILQCMGDAVFIPAGAPHQVRNLHSCVKAAEDFVSPENMEYCFKMTQEFRLLSDTHSNHEDKLQVKNMIYHAVKDAVAVLKEADP